MRENWIEKISENIDQQVEMYISVRDYRFYQIEKLKRIAKLLENQGDCLDCKHAKTELESVVMDLDRLINKSGTDRSEYEKRVEKIIKHLKDKHQVYQSYYFTYTYSAIYIFIGCVFGLLISYGLYFEFNATLFFLCAGIGMFLGNVLGSRKDNSCKRTGKQI